MKKQLYFTLALLFILHTITAFAQPPNDEPCNAIALNLNASCSFAQYTNLNATASSGVPAPGCASYAGGDVWFTAVVPSDGIIHLDSDRTGMTDGGMAIYSGTCTSLNLIECDDDDSGNGLMPAISATGLTPGSTIWIRFWEYGNNNNGVFDICAYGTVSVVAPPCTTAVCSSPIPDDCNSACSLTLSAPAPCPSVASVTDYFCLSNVGAMAENPYTYLSNCQAIVGNDMPAPSADVWYSFVATSTIVNLSVIGLDSPSMALYQGINCSDMFGLECDNGVGNVSISSSALTIGQNYLVRVSGGSMADTGLFTLVVESQNNCDACLLESSLTVSPTPSNGTFQPGDVVQFCYTVSEWNATAANWFHGVIPTFSGQWNLSTLTPISVATSCDGLGTWAWYNSVYSTNVNSTFGPGFFYDLGGDSNPGNNFGDNCSNYTWTFCWEIEVSSSASVQNGDPLNISIATTGDSETGSWSSAGCVNDPVTNFFSSVSACVANLSVNQTISCFNACDGEIVATSNVGTAPFNFVWRDSLGTIIRTQTNAIGSDTYSGLCAGTYYVEITDNNACVASNSIIIENPMPADSTTENITICENALPYTFADGTIHNIVSNSSHSSTFSTSNGCDSVIVTNLVVNPNVSTTENIVICENDLPYTFADGTIHNVVSNSSHSSTFSTSNGCDSILVTNLVVNPNVSTTENIVICENDLPYTFADGTIHNIVSNSSHSSTFSTSNGCDSVIVTNLVVNPNVSTTENITICENDLPYTFADGTIHNVVSNSSHSSTFSTSNGCDSVIVTNLVVNPNVITTENIVICENDLPYTFADGTIHNIVSNSSHSSTFSTSNGCDSVIVTNLVVNPNVSTTENIVICENDLPYTFADGTIHNAVSNSSHSSTFSTSNGCDSIVVTNLVVNQVYSDTGSVSICVGALPYTFADGTIYNSINSIIHTSVLQSINGCDSLFTLHLTINDAFYVIEEVELCEGLLPYTFPDGTILDSVDVLTHMSYLSTVYGCDSTIETRISVIPTIREVENITLCSSDLPYEFPDGTIYNETENISYESFSNCDSSIITNLTINLLGEIGTLPDSIGACNLEPKNLFIPSENIASYTWYVNDGTGENVLTNADFNYEGISTNELKINVLDTSMNGNVYFVEMTDFCGNILQSNKVYLSVHTPQVLANPIEDIEVCIEDIEPLYVDYFNGYNYEWSNGTIGQYLDFSESGTYIVNFIEEITHCAMADTIAIEVIDCVEECVVEFPTGFSPNASGFNDVFRPMTNCQDGFDLYHLKIFNRWGELIFESFKAKNGWDGNYQGVAAPIGDYAFHLTYIKEGKQNILEKKGVLTLIK